MSSDLFGVVPHPPVPLTVRHYFRGACLLYVQVLPRFQAYLTSWSANDILLFKRCSCCMQFSASGTLGMYPVKHTEHSFYDPLNFPVIIPLICIYVNGVHVKVAWWQFNLSIFFLFPIEALWGPTWGSNWRKR